MSFSRPILIITIFLAWVNIIVRLFQLNNAHLFRHFDEAERYFRQTHAYDGVLNSIRSCSGNYCLPAGLDHLILNLAGNQSYFLIRSIFWLLLGFCGLTLISKSLLLKSDHHKPDSIDSFVFATLLSSVPIVWVSAHEQMTEWPFVVITLLFLCIRVSTSGSTRSLYRIGFSTLAFSAMFLTNFQYSLLIAGALGVFAWVKEKSLTAPLIVAAQVCAGFAINVLFRSPDHQKEYIQFILYHSNVASTEYSTLYIGMNTIDRILFPIKSFLGSYLSIWISIPILYFSLRLLRRWQLSRADLAWTLAFISVYLASSKFYWKAPQERYFLIANLMFFVSLMVGWHRFVAQSKFQNTLYLFTLLVMGTQAWIAPTDISSLGLHQSFGGYAAPKRNFNLSFLDVLQTRDLTHFYSGQECDPRAQHPLRQLLQDIKQRIEPICSVCGGKSNPNYLNTYSLKIALHQLEKTSQCSRVVVVGLPTTSCLWSEIYHDLEENSLETHTNETEFLLSQGFQVLHNIKTQDYHLVILGNKFTP